MHRSGSHKFLPSFLRISLELLLQSAQTNQALRFITDSETYNEEMHDHSMVWKWFSKTPHVPVVRPSRDPSPPTFWPLRFGSSISVEFISARRIRYIRVIWTNILLEQRAVVKRKASGNSAKNGAKRPVGEIRNKRNLATRWLERRLINDHRARYNNMQFTAW